METTGAQISVITVTEIDDNVKVYYFKDLKCCKHPQEYAAYLKTFLGSKNATIESFPIHRIVRDKTSNALKQYELAVLKKEQQTLNSLVTQKETELGQ